MKNRILGFLLLLPLLLALPGAVQKPTEDQLKGEWSAFLKEYEAAQKAWMKPYTDAKTEAERASVKLDFENQPAKTFAPRALEFAKKAKGSELEVTALVWAYSYGQAAGKDVKIAALDALLKDHIKSPKLVQVAQSLQYDGFQISEEKAQKALLTLAEKSPVAEVKATALYSLGALNMPYQGGTPEQTKKAKEYFDKLIKQYPTTKAAERAKSSLFELNNLQIGQIAPDFEATDENGVKFKLSDYRGKVVIVDFWGFW